MAGLNFSQTKRAYIMLTKLDLCSMAFLKLGEEPIQSFQQDTASAKISRTLYDTVIDSLLSVHPWRFATSELRLAKNSNNEFLIPANVLRILKTDGHIFGNKIHSDKDSILITALVRTAPEDFPSYFISVAATRLAMEFCLPLQGDKTLFRTLVSLYETELQTAKFIDSTMTTSTLIDKFSLISARF